MRIHFLAATTKSFSNKVFSLRLHENIRNILLFFDAMKEKLD